MSWEVSLSTGLFLRYPLLDVLEPISRAGFRRIQVSGFSHHFAYHDAAVVAAVGREMARLGMQATSLHAPFNPTLDLTLPDEPARLSVVAEVKRTVEALAALGGNILVIHPGSEDEKALDQAPQRLQQSVRSLGEVYEHCRRFGITMAIEDMLAHLLGGRTEDMEWVLARLPGPGIGVCLDTGHSFLARDLPDRARRWGGRLVMVHAHDNKGQQDDHLPPGEGYIPWPHLLDILGESRFQGEIVLELREDSDVAELLRRANRGVSFLQECARGKPYSIGGD